MSVWREYDVWEKLPDRLIYIRSTWAVSEEHALNNVRWTTYGRVAVEDLYWPLVATRTIESPPRQLLIVQPPKPVKTQNKQLVFRDFLKPKPAY